MTAFEGGYEALEAYSLAAVRGQLDDPAWKNERVIALLVTIRDEWSGDDQRALEAAVAQCVPRVPGWRRRLRAAAGMGAAALLGRNPQLDRRAFLQGAAGGAAGLNLMQQGEDEPVPTTLGEQLRLYLPMIERETTTEQEQPEPTPEEKVQTLFRDKLGVQITNVEFLSGYEGDAFEAFRDKLEAVLNIIQSDSELAKNTAFPNNPGKQNSWAPFVSSINKLTIVADQGDEVAFTTLEESGQTVTLHLPREISGLPHHLIANELCHVAGQGARNPNWLTLYEEAISNFFSLAAARLDGQEAYDQLRGFIMSGGSTRMFPELYAQMSAYVSNVGIETGYADQDYFMAAFKRIARAVASPEFYALFGEEIALEITRLMIENFSDLQSVLVLMNALGHGDTDYGLRPEAWRGIEAAQRAGWAHPSSSPHQDLGQETPQQGRLVTVPVYTPSDQDNPPGLVVYACEEYELGDDWPLLVTHVDMIRDGYLNVYVWFTRDGILQQADISGWVTEYGQANQAVFQTLELPEYVDLADDYRVQLSQADAIQLRLDLPKHALHEGDAVWGNPDNVGKEDELASRNVSSHYGLNEQEDDIVREWTLPPSPEHAALQALLTEEVADPMNWSEMSQPLVGRIEAFLKNLEATDNVKQVLEGIRQAVTGLWDQEDVSDAWKNQIQAPLKELVNESSDDGMIAQLKSLLFSVALIDPERLALRKQVQQAVNKNGLRDKLSSASGQKEGERLRLPNHRLVRADSGELRVEQMPTTEKQAEEVLVKSRPEMEASTAKKAPPAAQSSSYSKAIEEGRLRVHSGRRLNSPD